MFSDTNAPGGFFMPQDGGAQQPAHGQPGQPGAFGVPPPMYGAGAQAMPPQGQYGAAMGGYPGAPPSGGYGMPTVGGVGGFMPNMNQQMANPYANNQSSMNQTPAQDRRKAKVFTPVTVKMVSNAQPRPDDVCEYDGDPINDIILCGRILRRIEEPMRTQFEINDNTGTFYVLFYHKGENQVPTALRNFVYEQFSYVKVYGNIRVFKEEKAIVGSHIKKIEKFDELTNHFLSVYVSHCIRKKGILKPRELQMSNQEGQYNQNQATTGGDQAAGVRTMGNGATNQFSGNRSNEHSSAQNHHGSGGHPPQGMQIDRPPPGSTGQDSMSKMFDPRRAILEVMKQMTKTQKFVNKHQLFQLLQDKTDQPSFDREMDRLLNDGEICTAFDQNHYCLTN